MFVHVKADLKQSVRGIEDHHDVWAFDKMEKDET